MLVIFGILIIVASVILGFIVLIQNPKGGGLSGSLSGISNQLMGVKQTTDVLEKGTWIFAAVVGILCLVSPAFIPKNASSSSSNDDLLKNTVAPAAKPAVPANTGTMTTTPKVDSPKK
ncbi:preprotein translocase subunit SecG [Ferruginibacter yonginensis]|uniref:Protein-export membrane protein SecG n=1 Tax=Ferruginibacter yonginensis TaxID=1310416 RepID=A0ABV8QQF8_9BACT